jgi:hypothetical protein
MGIIIVDGRAALQFKGSISEFETAVRGLIKLQSTLGPSGLMIDTVPLPEGGIIIDLRFKGSLSDFGNVIEGLHDLRSTSKIDTVPVLEGTPKIGTWPTPEIPEEAFGWSIFAHVKEK